MVTWIIGIILLIVVVFAIKHVKKTNGCDCGCGCGCDKGSCSMKDDK